MRSLLLTGTFAALTACGGPPLVEVVDLAVLANSAEVLVEPGILDIGTAEARPSLVAGWWNDEHNRKTGERFVWSSGDHSEIEFYLGWRRDLEVEFVCRAFTFPGSPVQEVDIELNGLSVGRLHPAREMHTYSLKLPAAAQVVGRNRMLFSYSHSRAPADVNAGSGDRRELAVAWHQLAFSGPGLPSEATPLTVDKAAVLRLGRGSRWDFFVHVPAGGVLRIGSLLGQKGTELELRVSAQHDLGHETEVTVLSSSPGEIRLDLGIPAGLARLRFEVTSEGSTSPGWIELRSPAILAPVAPVQMEPVAVVPRQALAPDRPNVIIYLVDALRADRLGCYGYQRPVSPRLDAFAAEGILFGDAVAQSSWTKASVASIFTGVWPPAHGAIGPEDVLPSNLPTLPERFAKAGYQTAAVIANAYVNRPFGFARGFDHFSFLPSGKGSSEAVNRRVFQWLDRRPEGPFFLFIHTIDPHAPYAAPEPFQSRFAGEVTDPSVGLVDTVRGLVLGTVAPSLELARDLSALYDAEVAHNDASFGAFLDDLRARDLYDDSVIFFVSDHGEAFGEHTSWTHGIDLYSEVLSVPLVLRLPGGLHAGRRVEDLAQHIDILPTVLHLAGIEGSTPGRGRDLLESSGAQRTAASHLDYWGRNGASLVTDSWKFIEPLDERFAPSSELYDRIGDPREVHDLATARPIVVGYLAARLRLEKKTRTESATIDIDEEMKKELKALGYLH